MKFSFGNPSSKLDKRNFKNFSISKIPIFIFYKRFKLTKASTKKSLKKEENCQGYNPWEYGRNCKTGIASYHVIGESGSLLCLLMFRYRHSLLMNKVWPLYKCDHFDLISLSSEPKEFQVMISLQVPRYFDVQQIITNIWET